MDKLCTSDSASKDFVANSDLENEDSPAASALPRGVLVVDDDDAVRSMLNVALGQRGYRIWQACDGNEAVSLYVTHRSEIALILLDVRMPALDGPQALAAIRKIDPAVPACFMSGHSGNYSHEELLELGAARVFEKPFHLADVLQAIEELTRVKIPRKG